MLVGKDVMPKKLTKTPTKEGGKMKATGLGLAHLAEEPAQERPRPSSPPLPSNESY